MSDAVTQLYRAIGQQVRAARERAEMTQETLAARVGLTRTSVTNVEHGRQKIQVHTLCALADVLGVPCSTLLPASQTQIPSAVDKRNLARLTSPERDWVVRIIGNPQDTVDS